jgi:hypothetical protein
VHEDVRVRLFGKVPLHRFVGAVGVTDEDLKALLDHRVETGLHLCGKPRDLREPATKTAGMGGWHAR